MKPVLLKGTRDFLPNEVAKREYIFETIKSVFQLYGYLPIETPAMEHLSTLTGKYGDEGDKLLFKLLNNGDFLKKANDETLKKRDSYELIPSISKRGLRYDLTVPFARFVVMHQNDIKFPFKRYQIQPVWRADRPQRGRYQEFYQCDVDVVGSNSLLYEAELVQIYQEVFRSLGLEVTIKVNNRKVLLGIAIQLGFENEFIAMTTAIDKLDKIGIERVKEELIAKGFNTQKVNELFVLLKETSIDKLVLKNEDGQKGLEELTVVFDYLEQTDNVVFDPTLARGLSYYTGCIFEVVSSKVNIGSIGGGGRYDDLTSKFGLKGVSGVGVSFGAERIYDVMQILNAFPKNIEEQTKLILLSLDKESLKLSFNLARELRLHGISTEVYPDAAKFKKQMQFANDRKIPYVLIVGEEERLTELFTLKNMQDGEQQKHSLDEIISLLK